MFKNGSMWKPPPRHSKADMKIIKKAVETGEVQRRGQLSNSQRDKLEDMLRSMTVERDTVGSCMFWCLQHGDAAQEVVECIGESLSILQTPPTVKAARLFLLNDLLYNSCAEVQNASSYRTKLETKLADIVINLKATLDEIKTHTAREKYKSQVLGCLRAWREWNVYSPDYLAQLDIIFAGGKSKEVDVDEVDGVPLDVDGVPLSKDVDGEPLADPDPEDEDMFDMTPKKNASKAPPIKSKWEDAGPSLGSKWEESNTAPSLGSKWESNEPAKKNLESNSKSSDEKRKKKREIEVKVAEYIDKLESGKCTRIKQITTNEQAEIYRYLLCKGKDAKKTIKHIATGRESLTELQSEMKSKPLSSPVISGKLAGLGGLVSYGSSPTSSPSPELKRRREHSDKKKRSASPKHERKKKSRH